MSRTEIRDLLNKYEKAVEEDAYGLLRPSAAEIKAVGKEILSRRAERVRTARDVNRRFIEAVIEDLPDLCAGPLGDEEPARPVAAFKELPRGTSTLPASSYGSMASVFLHLFRDWSPECEHVYKTTYGPAIAKLKEQLPNGGEVLVPGCGLARLALELAAEGYTVEANEGSRLFLTFADYVINRAPAEGQKLYPLAHVFSENWSYGEQYVDIIVPSPTGAALAAKGAGASRAGPAITMVPGDFVETYKVGGSGHRKFNAIVTCFFLDTVIDIAELVAVLDSLLDEGGVWVNVGPLNWRKEARMKLNWDEVLAIWKGYGYTFHCQERVDCDYHLQRGRKMYTESYTCTLTSATKGRASKV